MKVCYEWDIETVDRHGDILDHDHSATCPTRPLALCERLVLVRDEVAEDGDVQDRTWAYVRGGKLPERFSDCDEDEGRRGEKVPQRFHAELLKANAARARR